jgi:hypothetical protein
VSGEISEMLFMDSSRLDRKERKDIAVKGGVR